MTPTIREFVLVMGSSLPASIVAKATVIAAFGLMGARLARRSRAAVRHVLLAATFCVLLLLPVASLTVPPVRIAVPTVRMRKANLSAPAAGGEWILPFTPPDTHPPATSAASRSSSPPLSALLVMGWLAGVTLALIPMIASLWEIRCLRRSGLPWADGQKVVDRLSLESGFRKRVEVVLHEALPGPIAYGMLHPTILFPPDAQTWGSEDLDRAAVHELEHLRRGDVVTHCLARVVCAAYWFHPLVWMAWRQLLLEAERSCDDAVIARSEATAYADQLVGLARRLLTAAKSPVLAMANRSDLVLRVGALLDTRQRRGRAGRSMVVLAWFAAAVLVLTVSPLRMVSARHSSSTQIAPVSRTGNATPTPLPSFEVASIRPSRSNENFSGNEAPGRFTRKAETTVWFIRYAYWDVQSATVVSDDQLAGAPRWAYTEKYDIDAKVEDSLAEQLSKLPWEQSRRQYALMVQSLLADRFKLKIHHETRELPVYALVVAKGGPKFLQSPYTRAGSIGQELRGPGGAALPPAPPGMRRLANHVSVAMLAQALSRNPEVGRMVFDQTGLQGEYDFMLQWAPQQGSAPMAVGPAGGNPSPDANPASDASGPSIFTALPQQLGLKLEPTRGPADVLVIDHIERPSEN